MRLTGLRFKGVGRFRDEVTVPIAELGDARVVAVCGSNGAGKTSMIEMPQGALYGTTPAHGEIARFANAADSFIEAKVATDQEYTARRLIKATLKTPKTEAYLTDSDGEPLNDGKAGTFDAAVSARFPSQDVYLASAYSSQKRRGQFLKIERPARKALFAEMLGLGHLEEMAKAAGDRAKAIEGRVGTLRGQASALETQASTLVALRAQLVEDKARLGEAAARVAMIKDAETAATAALEAWQKRSDELERVYHERRVEAEAVRSRLLNLRDRERMANERVSVIVGTRMALAKKLEGRAALEKIAGGAPRSDELAAAEAALSDLRAESERHATERLAVERRRSELQRIISGEGYAVQANVARLEAELKVARSDYRRAKDEADLVLRVPCKGEGAYSGCPLLKQAQESKEELAAQEHEGKRLADLLAAAKAGRTPALEKAEKDLAALGEVATEPGASPAVGHLEDQIRALRDATSKASAARAALDGLAHVQEQDAQLSNESASLKKTLQDIAAESEPAAIQSTKASADVVASGDALKALDAKPAKFDKAEIDSAIRAESGAASAVSVDESRIDAAETAVGALAAVKAELGTALTDIDDWRELQRALGQSGVQALEIDAAGPEVSAIINDLLHTCYGLRFSCALETTALKADGSGTREVFDLRVVDSEMGTDGSADELSGGEETIVAEALGIAVAIFNKRRSQIPMLEIWRDECSGQLDADAAVLYVTMLRKALEVGGFERVYFVAHQPRLWELADARLVIEDGKVRAE